MTISNTEYWTEVRAIAANVVQEAAERLDMTTAETFDPVAVHDEIFDTILHETIDGHQWVIYYAYNLPVLQHTDNAEYGIDQGLIDATESIKQGLNTLHCHLAFWALYADVCDYLNTAIEEYEQELNQ